MARFKIRPAITLTLALAVGCARVGLLRAQAPPISQYRGLWIDTFNSRLNTHEDILRVVQDAQSAGINAIFAQVRRRGDAWYRRSLEPEPDGVPLAREFDPLDDLIAEAHARGIEVHAFVIVCALWNSATLPMSPAHVFNRHGLDATGRPYEGSENWLTRTLLPDGTATSVGGYRIGSEYWMDPGHPDAAAYTVEVLSHLVRQYDVDGLHLDRIRYPEISVTGQTPATGASIGYNDTSIVRFQRRYGLPAGSPAPLPNDPLWNEWRREQVTELVRRISLNALAINPRLKISAALIAFGGGPTTEDGWSTAEAYWRVFQDWRAWMREGILDLGVPMNYKTEHTATGARMFDEWLRWTRRQQFGPRALVGQGAFLNAIEGTLRQTRRALGDGDTPPAAAGVVFFSAANSNTAVPSNPFSIPAGQSTPRRPFAELAWGLRTGRSSDGAVLYEDPAAGPAVFAAAAAPPELRWKTSPDLGHLMGLVTVSREPADGATVAISRSERRRSAFEPDLARPPAAATGTDGGGFYGFVDLTPGDYRVVVDVPGSGTFLALCRAEIEPGRVARVSVRIDPRRPAVAVCEEEDGGPAPAQARH